MIYFIRSGIVIETAAGFIYGSETGFIAADY